MQEIKNILNLLGFKESNYERVRGGDINSSYRIHSGHQSFFLKLNIARSFPEMFRLEAAGLKTLAEFSSFKIPEVIKEGILGNHQFLLIEWLETKFSDEDDQLEAGKKLVLLHQQQHQEFGWIEDNFIGSLKQVNHWHTDWNSFYAECRIMPLIGLLFDSKTISKKVVEDAEKFCTAIPELFPEEPASLLHGDLWSGNYMHTSRGPALIDPAVYYGHREMDIGMTKLFGGFSSAFYQGYNDIYPLEKNWEKRLPYSQLYPLLVHAVLFGAGYIQRCVSTLGQFR